MPIIQKQKINKSLFQTLHTSNPVVHIFLSISKIILVFVIVIAGLFWINDSLMQMMYPSYFGSNADLSWVEIVGIRPFTPLARILCLVKGGFYQQNDPNGIGNCIIWTGYTGTYESPTIGKPVIYLYPTYAQKIKVKLDFSGKLLSTFPKYDQIIHGWEVTAYPDGKILDSNNHEFSYLFWDGTDAKIKYDMTKGFVVPGKDSADFLRDYLSQSGLTPWEYNEFIVYWMPKMENNPYNLIHFAGQEYTDAAKLDITPKPDSLLRIFMVFQPLAHEVSISPQPIIPFVRKGFTVVEWGGSELNSQF